MKTALKVKLGLLKAVTLAMGGGFLFFYRILFVGCLLIVALSTNAATYYVSPSGNDANSGASWELAKQTIQAAINISTNGDTVLVADGTYAPITIVLGITVRSVNGAQATIINGGGVTRCAFLNMAAVLDGFTVTSGYASYNYGGGVYAYYGSVRNCMITGNTGSYGGGIYTYYGTVENCVISGNTAGSYGGIYTYGGAVRNCTISGNSGDAGGGVAVAGGGTVQNCTISDNSTHGRGDLNDFGGGISVWRSKVRECKISGNKAAWGGGVTIWRDGMVQDCSISANVATYGGGGVLAVRKGTVRNCLISGNSTLLLEHPVFDISEYGSCGGGVLGWDGIVQDCTISGNWAADFGGGVYASFGTVQGCTISGNGAFLDAGGISIWNGTVRNCLVIGNLANDFGGGMFVYSSAVWNCTVIANAAKEGGGLYNANTSIVQNCIAYYNQNGDANGAVSTIFSSCIGADIGGVGNITNAPQFVFLGTGYGTDHVPGNYRLQPTSPCINAGLNQFWMTNAFDLDGAARVIARVVDMGAYEGFGVTNAIMRNPAILINQGTSGANAASQVIEVWYEGTRRMTYTLSANVDWLSLSPASGSSAGKIDLVSVNYASAGLLPGSYTGIVTITSADAINSPQVVMVYLAVKTKQTITFPAITSPQPATSQVGLAATASSGLPVSFAVASGPGRITGGTNLTFRGAGTVCVVASQAGNSIYHPAPNVTNVVLVERIGQTIIFPPIPSQTVTATVGLAATASSGLPVSFVVASGPGTISGRTNLLFTAIGTVWVVACQAGNAIYYPAPNVTNVTTFNRISQTIYVSPRGNNANDGTSWQLAKQTIQAAINAAIVGDTVLVADGIYAPITISQGITVRSVNGAQATVINGGGVTRCALLNVGGVLDGFTVTRGYAYYNYGGGVYAYGGMVRNCTINGNTAYYRGGGIWIYAGTVENCTISGNTLLYYYGYGGGVYAYGSTVRNCTIAGNTARYGGGVYAYGGTMENCTVVGNTVISVSSSNNAGGGVYVRAGTVRNCIVYHNQGTDASGPISYSCIGIGTNITGVGNITNEPQFVSTGTGYGTNLVQGNYRLRPTSPCINKGLNQSWMTNAVDLDGLPRILDSVVDIGAYEWSGTNILIMRNPAVLFNQCGYGSNASSQMIEVWNAGTNTMAYALSANVGWLSISPARGTSVGETDLVSVNYASAGVLPGTYTGIVTIISAEASNSPQVVTIYLLVEKAEQTISFPAIASQVATSKVGLAATASSGLLVSFTAVSGPGIITGGTNLSFTAAGSVQVFASQPGNEIYNPAPEVTNAVLVERASQAITFPAIPDQVATSRVGLVATDSSGLPVSFTVASGPGVISGGTNLSFATAGTVQVVASQAGDVIYAPAADVLNSFSVTKASAVVTLNNLNQTYNGTPRSVTASTVPEGLTVEITYDGSSAAPTDAGTYLVVGMVNDSIYEGSANGMLTVAKADQVITSFIPTNGAVLATTSMVGLAAQASSGLLVTNFAVISGPGVISGLTNLTFTNSGSVTVTVDQAGDHNWNSAAAVTNTLLVKRAGQTITFLAIPIQVVTSQVSLAATASSGLSVSFAVVSGPGVITDGTNLSFTADGTVLVAASQAGNAIWEPAPLVTNEVKVTILPVGVIQLVATSVEVSEAGGSITLSVERTGGSYGPASVEYATADGTALAGSDYTMQSGTLSWADGEAISRAITVFITDDILDENHETFTVRLGNVQGANLGAANVASVTILDNDEPPRGVLQFAVASVEVNESSASATLTVTRTGGSYGAASVEYLATAGTATAGLDYETVQGTLSWADRDSSSKTISVAITDDSIDENNETFTVTLINAQGASLGSASSATVTILDNDEPPGEDLNQVDLEVAGFKFVPVNLWAGDHPAEIEFDLVNAGPGDLVTAGTQLEISFYLSANQTLGDADDIAIGTKIEVLALPAGSQSTIRYPGRAHNTDITIPESLSGDYYVFVSVQLASSAGLYDPDSAAAMREGSINVQIHSSDDGDDPSDGDNPDDGDNSKQRSVLNDYDADGQSDIMEYNEGSGEWVIQLSASGSAARFIFGGSGYESVAGDYDGDLRTDPAVHQRQGYAWQIMLSGLGYATINFDFGAGSKTRGVVADYNDDSLADPGLYEEQSGRWYVFLPDERGNYGIASVLFGGPGWAPVVGDYDGDSRADPALYEETTGNWLVMLSALGYGVVNAVMGGPGYHPVPADYDGDGKTDLAIMDASGGWYYRLSGGGYALSGPDEFGKSGRPMPGNYDGDSKADPAVRDSFGNWYFWLSGNGYSLESRP